MNFIPPFEFHRVVIAPWTTDLDTFGWIALMGFLVATACGLVGNYLILRRMALVGDAISAIQPKVSRSVDHGAMTTRWNSKGGMKFMAVSWGETRG